MAKNITFSELSTSTDEDSVARVNKAITEVTNLMGENLTDEVAKAVSKLLSEVHNMGWTQGGADERYEG